MNNVPGTGSRLPRQPNRRPLYSCFLTKCVREAERELITLSLLVQKFGGTSVADSNKILAAARRAIKAHHRGEQVLVVVSARGTRLTS